MKSGEIYRFRLYVADHTPDSKDAVANLTALCNLHLQDRHEIEVIDVFRQPKEALAHRIVFTPTVVKVAPAPVRSFEGPLSDTALVLHTLGIDPTSI